MEFIGVTEGCRHGLVPREVRASQLVPVMAYDPAQNYFYMNDQTIGFGFMCQPLCGGDERVQERLKNMLNQQFPHEAMLQFMLFRSPDVHTRLEETLRLREHFNHPLLSEIVRSRVRFIRHHTAEPIMGRGRNGLFNNGVVHDLKLVISFKMPIADLTPSPAELEALAVCRDKLEASLKNIGFAPRVLDATGLKRVLSTLLNWGGQASWRHGYEQWDDTQPLCEQVFDFDTDVEVDKHRLRVGSAHVKVLSAKKLPATFYFGDAITYAGDVSGQGQSVKENYAICCNVYFPHPQRQKKSLQNKRTFTVNQAVGFMPRLLPVLGEKVRGFDALDKSMSAGNRSLCLNYCALVFAPTAKRAEAAAVAMQDIWAENRFTLLEDRFIALPMLINVLPFGAAHRAVVELNRYKTMTSEHATVLLPLFGEWKGTGTPHVSLFSRNGQLMSLSLHDSETNKNALIAAESGSGKSFLANELLLSYLSEGATVWVIDAGKSYEKLCATLDGAFVQFGEASPICLNPFDLVEDYLDDEDTLVSLVCAMASPHGRLDELQVAELKKVMATLWQQHGKGMGVDHIAEACQLHEDPRVRDIGTQLYVFTRDGSYGKYWHGRNSMRFNNAFTVLELDELQGRKHLRQVVLLQLIYQIQQAVFLGDRNTKKVVFIDEAWDLLKEGEVATFIEHAYRKFRKYGGSVIIATQSINDLYDNSVGRAVAENSASMFLLGQTSETVESVKRSGRLALSDGGFNLLKTVHTVAGVYSEVFVRSKAGIGVGRLIVGDFQKLLYSTDPNDVGQIERYRAQGLSVTEAIYAVIRDRGLPAAPGEAPVRAEAGHG